MKIARTIDIGGIQPPSDAYSQGSDTATGALSNLELLISNIIGFITVMGGIFFVIYFVLGAFQWITSGGDKGKAEQARKKITDGAIGMVIMVASYAIIGLIGSFIGIDLLNPAEQIREITNSI